MKKKLFLIITLILGILGIAFGAIMQYAFDLFTFPVACVVATGSGCVVGSVMNLIFIKTYVERGTK